MNAQLTAAQLRRAAEIASQIEQLEMAREDAQDEWVFLELGKPTEARPMGADYTVSIRVLIPATTIRMALVEQATPLYTELRNLGVDILR